MNPEHPKIPNLELFESFQRLVGRRVLVNLKDGPSPKGQLNYVGEQSARTGKPWISLDVGDEKALAQYNLDWDNIVSVSETEK